MRDETRHQALRLGQEGEEKMLENANERGIQLIDAGPVGVLSPLGACVKGGDRRLDLIG